MANSFVDNGNKLLRVGRAHMENIPFTKKKTKQNLNLFSSDLKSSKSSKMFS